MTVTLAPSHPSGQELFAARGVELRRGASSFVIDVRASGRGLVCLHEAAALVRAAWDETALLRGEVLLLGRPSRELLTSGFAGYAPAELPGGASLRVNEALFLGARLIGRTQDHVRAALERVGGLSLGKRRLGELEPLEQRRVGLAHGVMSSPELLLFDDLFSGLDGGDQETLGALLDELLEGRRFVGALTTDAPRARRLAQRADRVLLPRGSSASLVPPAEVPARGHWVTTAEPAAPLASALREAGARVIRGPRPEVLWVTGATSLTIFDAADASAATVLTLAPAGWGQG